ncbi:MAG: chemotaxis protein CheA, partial [Clostridiales bacterium]|nr:chemotaxis protein CheA [Clostridiales bacterium]
TIRRDGFKLAITTNLEYEEVSKIIGDTLFIKDLKVEKKEIEVINSPGIEQIDAQGIIEMEADGLPKEGSKKTAPAAGAGKKSQPQHSISVSIGKLDQLLNLMGELVIAEAMVTQNPDLDGLELENFFKETRQLRKIINDVQDTVMSMRMVPLSTTFYKMHRIVRDMSKALNKDVVLEIVGEETEVDKNIIEHISDPLMHIIRNSVDHGIELPEERRKAGKTPQGTVLLEAKNSGGDVLIMIKDNGKGLDREKILNKAKVNGLLKKADDDYSDKEIYQFIFLPGFSTNEVVTGYSGRGVGMDVVVTNLEEVGGIVLVDSTPGEGSVFTLKIPLTLAIIEGMTIKVAGDKYTIPIISIKQSFKPSAKSIFMDPNGNEMITVRGEVYNVVRLNEFFGIDGGVTDAEDGIMIMLENGDQTVCLLADELLGEQQVVVKSMPKYIKKNRGISGCTLLGNGDISLIIDTAGFFDK